MSMWLMKCLGRGKMDNLDLVVEICKAEKGLTNNRFYSICEKYGLSVEQMKQALALVNGLTKVPEGGK